MDPGDDLVDVGKGTIHREMDSAALGHAGDDWAFGNEEGRSLLDDMFERREAHARMAEQWEKRFQQLERKQADDTKRLESQHAEDSETIQGLQEQVSHLLHSSNGYHQIRHRLIDNYISLGQEGFFPRSRIESGNQAAHWGDANSTC